MNFAQAVETVSSAHLTEWLIVVTNFGLILVTLALVAQGVHDTNALVKIVEMLTRRGSTHKGKHER